MTKDDEIPVVRLSVLQSDWEHLLDSIRQERCAHSWRNFSPSGTFEQLVAWENALRPTQIFFYYCPSPSPSSRQEGDANTAEAGLRLAGVATVADAIRREFPYPGFPVLARCYILPEFRARGLYRRIVQHRLAFCHERWGDGLRAIHIGTADDRVAQTLTGGGADRPLFVRIGSQLVRAGEDICRVGAFLHFMPRYAQAMTQALCDPAGSAAEEGLRRALSRLHAGGTGEDGLEVCRLFGQLRDAGALGGRDVSSIAQFVSLCQAIPLAGIDALASPRRGT